MISTGNGARNIANLRARFAHVNLQYYVGSINAKKVSKPDTFPY